MITGIYQIKNTKNNKVYVGYAKDISKRWRNHLSSLRRNKHDNEYLQHSWNKYKEKSFVFEVLEECHVDELVEKEKYYIDFLNTLSPKGYNLNKGGLGNYGWKPSRKTIVRKSISSSGKNNPMYGKTHSAETRAIFSKQRIGNKNGIGNKNNLDRVKKYKNATSKYYGVFKSIYVYKLKKKVRWKARFSIDGKEIKLGTYVLEKDAAKAFDKKSWEIHGNLEKLNFPEDYK